MAPFWVLLPMPPMILLIRRRSHAGRHLSQLSILAGALFSQQRPLSAALGFGLCLQNNLIKEI